MFMIFVNPVGTFTSQYDFPTLILKGSDGHLCLCHLIPRHHQAFPAKIYVVGDGDDDVQQLVHHEQDGDDNGG